jgi:hypothetical protein
LKHDALVVGDHGRRPFEGADRLLDCERVVCGVPAHEHHAVGAHGCRGDGRLVSEHERLSVVDFDQLDVFRHRTGTVAVVALRAAPQTQQPFV